MDLTEGLLHDHQVLRAKLDLLEQRLPHIHAAPFTLLSLIRAIARRLQQHAESLPTPRISSTPCASTWMGKSASSSTSWIGLQRNEQKS